MQNSEGGVMSVYDTVETAIQAACRAYLFRFRVDTWGLVFSFPDGLTDGLVSVKANVDEHTCILFETVHWEDAGDNVFIIKVLGHPRLMLNEGEQWKMSVTRP